MLNYELAKELKDAGFPFIKSWLNKDGSYCETPRSFSKEFLIPTLEELIEACGIGLRAIAREVDNVPGQWIWAAKPMIQPNEGFITDYVGTNPSEVVARLWLALNRK